MGAFGAYVMMAIGVTYIGIAAIIPFIAGLLGYSRRVSYVMAVALPCGLLFLELLTFSDALKYQSIYRLAMTDLGVTALCAVELLFVFVLAHWLGARFRGGFIWVKTRLEAHS
jgi:hypothetical protein